MPGRLDAAGVEPSQLCGRTAQNGCLGSLPRLTQSMIKFCHVLPCVVFFAAGPAFAQATYTPPVTLLRDNIIFTVHWDGRYDYEEAVTQRLNTGAAVQDSGQSYIYYNGSPD